MQAILHIYIHAYIYIHPSIHPSVLTRRTQPGIKSALIRILEAASATCPCPAGMLLHTCRWRGMMATGNACALLQFG
jgi:hypothetical protein